MGLRGIMEISCAVPILRAKLHPLCSSTSAKGCFLHSSHCQWSNSLGQTALFLPRRERIATRWTTCQNHLAGEVSTGHSIRKREEKRRPRSEVQWMFYIVLWCFPFLEAPRVDCNSWAAWHGIDFVGRSWPSHPRTTAQHPIDPHSAFPLPRLPRLVFFRRFPLASTASVAGSTASNEIPRHCGSDNGNGKARSIILKKIDESSASPSPSIHGSTPNRWLFALGWWPGGPGSFPSHLAGWNSIIAGLIAILKFSHLEASALAKDCRVLGDFTQGATHQGTGPARRHWACARCAWGEEVLSTGLEPQAAKGGAKDHQILLGLTASPYIAITHWAKCQPSHLGTSAGSLVWETGKKTPNLFGMIPLNSTFSHDAHRRKSSPGNFDLWGLKIHWSQGLLNMSPMAPLHLPPQHTA